MGTGQTPASSSTPPWMGKRDRSRAQDPGERAEGGGSAQGMCVWLGFFFGPFGVVTGAILAREAGVVAACKGLVFAIGFWICVGVICALVAR